MNNYRSFTSTVLDFMYCGGHQLLHSTDLLDKYNLATKNDPNFRSICWTSS